MDVIATDDKTKPLPPYGGPPPQPVHRMPPPEGSHPLPSPHGLYEPSWRPYQPPFEAPNPDQRRSSSNPSQPPIHPGYAVPPNRELPQISHDAPYGRPNSLPGPTQSPSDPNTPHPGYRPMTTAPHEANPHTAPGEYRPRMAYPPPEPHANGEPTPHTIAPGQYPHMAHAPVSYEPGYYNPAYGTRHRKAARAQQVSAAILHGRD